MKKPIKETKFERGWRITLEAAGKGFSVCLYQFEGYVKSAFRFNKSEAERIYEESVKGWPDFSSRPEVY